MSDDTLKYAAAVDGILDDLDLSNMARDYTGLTNTEHRMSKVLKELDETYPGGVIQFYNEKKF